MAVFQTAKDNDQQNSEILVYQMGRYIDSDEAAWRSFGFPIQEREPFVQHLALHLENGQRIYFTKDTAIKIGMHQYIPYIRTTSNVSTSNLRMLLHDIREPISFADLKTIDDYLRTTGTAHFALQLPFNIAEEQFPRGPLLPATVQVTRLADQKHAVSDARSGYSLCRSRGANKQASHHTDGITAPMDIRNPRGVTNISLVAREGIRYLMARNRFDGVGYRNFHSLDET
ncbi:hypothetical protein EVAR_53767_1 [Eumeta japonica]|uniref:Uncharacterized protein n=1 Tax=Eumeta variegata TaxID=151549 RepID=A0A4C1Z5W6_EUMVA|nr:hypothetical protein EVAR_53767_1 [Eumeta japonica]